MTEAAAAAMSESATVTGVGQELAAAREARGLALADVARQLKFGQRQLEALEQERFSALPGGTFARGMVRNYARLLQLDPAPLIERMAGRFELPDANQLAARYHQPVPFHDGARRSTFLYLGLSAGVLALVGAVAYEWHQERTAAAKASKAASVAKAVPREIKRPAVAVPAQPVVASASSEKTISPENTAAPPPARSGTHRIAVRFEGEAWIEIKDATDRLIVSSLNPAGTERVVQGSRAPYALVIGNASHVRVSYNDKPVDLQAHTKGDVARFTLP
jgi:cytoskeleton protein RodZ